MATAITGKVKSAKGDKSIVVIALERRTHPIYKKQYSITRTFYAHDENNEAKTGDKVEIHSSKPISKTKQWKLHRVLEKAVED